MMNNKLFISAALLLGLASCKSGSDSSSYDKNSLDSTAIAAITEDSYKAYVAKLSSDEFMGRLPFSKGDTITVNYIQEQYKALGLDPGNGESYFQEVPMVEISSKPVNPTLTFKGKNGDLSAKYLDDYEIGRASCRERGESSGMN